MSDLILLDMPVIAKEWQTPDHPARLRDVLRPLKDADQGAPVLIDFTIYEDEPTTAHRQLHLGLSDGKGGITYQPPHQVGDAEIARAMLLAVTDPKLHATLETLRMHGLDIGAGSAFRITLARDILLAGPASQNEVSHYLENHKEFSSPTLHNLAFLALPPDLSEHRKMEIIPELDILLDALAGELMTTAAHRPIAFSAERIFRLDGAA